MKKSIIFISLHLLFFSSLVAQEYSHKFGKVTDEELKMKVYTKDSAANAVVIYDIGYTVYDVVNGAFRLSTDYSKKIKVLKKEGADEANITIPYYFKSGSEKELIQGLEAVSYNMENGKLIKTKLEKKNVYDEEMNSKYRRLKFSVPNVKEGSVIEVKFNKSSPFIYGIDSWYIQGDIPVIFSEYEVKIPEYFMFNASTKGFEKIEVSENPVNQQFSITSGGGVNTVSCSARDLKFTAKDIPGIKKENHVWCVKDFLSSVTFELKATHFPNDFYKPYTQTWDNLDKTIANETDFGSNIKMSNPYEKETKGLIAGVVDEKEKIEKIYSFLKEHINWNETYSFYGNKAKDAVKSGTGDNGQMNMILLSMLKTAGIKAYPVLISRRSMGRLPYTFPSFDQLNTFVVAAETQDGKIYYMDGSAVQGGLNMLPVDLLVDRARVFDLTKTEKWVDLSSIARSQQVHTIIANLDKDGKLTGNLKSLYTYNDAYDYKNNFKKAKDSADYVEKLKDKMHFDIDSFRIAGKLPMSNMVKEEITFSKNNEASGEFIYLNPLIVGHIDENPFKQSDRKLPIEFSYPHTFMVNCVIVIPDNYKVAEIPTSVRYNLNDNCKTTYAISVDGDKIILNYKYTLNQIVFPVTDYASLKEYFAHLANKNQEMIVLKKI